MDTEVVQAPKFRRPSFIRAVMRLRLGRAGLLTWKVLFFQQDCQTGQDCRARNRLVLRNRPSLPDWLRPSGRAVKQATKRADGIWRGAHSKTTSASQVPSSKAFK